MNAERKNLVIFGGSDFDAAAETWLAAEALGRAAAGAGWAVVSGGYGGCMEACSRGAAQAGGTATGVVCSIFKSPPNPYLTEIIRTENLYDRLRALIELGDAYVVMPGSTGTLAELALVWELVNKRMIPRRPILCWGEAWRPVVSIFSGDSTRDPRLDTRGLPDRRVELIQFVSTPEEVMAALS